MSTSSDDGPDRGSRSEAMSAVRDSVIGAAAGGAANFALTTDSFAYLASMAGLYEIEASRIALDRSKSDEVRDFAERMIADHNDIAGKLKSFLGGMNRPNSPPEELDALHRVLINDLRGADDADFDHRYIAQQRSAHEIATTLFTQYHKHGDDEGLRNLAGLGLPVLQKHQETIRAIAAKRQSG